VAEAQRYLGLELSGAKNQKTSLAVLEYYPREKKTFLLDIFDKIAPHSEENSDEALIDLIEEESRDEKVMQMGVNVPLTLPPCISCTPKTCPVSKHCGSPAAKWMSNYLKRVSRRKGLSQRINPFTPYTQRPIELWARYELLPQLSKGGLFEIDETLGGNRAPLAARMHFLKRQLTAFPLIECWPKLTISLLARKLGLSPRTVSSYRHLEQGAHFREEILISLAKHFEVFIYERDLRKLAQSLTGFDALICAFTALLNDQGECAKIPKGFPESSGWVYYPEA
jgi:hypothetical protein